MRRRPREWSECHAVPGHRGHRRRPRHRPSAGGSCRQDRVAVQQVLASRRQHEIGPRPRAASTGGLNRSRPVQSHRAGRFVAGKVLDRAAGQTCVGGGRTVSAASAGAWPKQFSRSAETGISTRFDHGRACSIASSRLISPSRRPNVLAKAPLEVASASKPIPARTRAEPTSHTLAKMKAPGP